MSDESKKAKRRGPLGHRIFIFLLSGLLTILFMWLLNFVLDDIGRLKGPNRSVMLEEIIPVGTRVRIGELNDTNRELRTQINNQREVQAILRDSTSNSRSTMNQLVELHRLNLEKDVTPTEAEQAALAESERLFLKNQGEYQEAVSEIAVLQEQLRGVKHELSVLNREVADLRIGISDEYGKLHMSHRMKQAVLKLAFLLPVLFAATFIFMKNRTSPYRPILIAAFLAAFAHTALVMHEYFPNRYFKYIALAAVTAIVLAFLVRLIRTVARPKTEWLLKQYREAYNMHRCPMCSYRIARGPLKFMIWTRKGPTSAGRGVGAGAAEAPGEDAGPYSCPSCGEQLYEKCDSCGDVRHSLLPFCEGCGAEKAFAPGEATEAEVAGPAPDGAAPSNAGI